MSKTERLQVLIESEQRRRLEREAAARGTSVATLVRQAIDLAFPVGMELRLDAAKTILEADPMDVPTVEELIGELDDIRSARR
jgi:hypothetical protein